MIKISFLQFALANYSDLSDMPHKLLEIQQADEVITYESSPAVNESESLDSHNVQPVPSCAW